MTGGLSNWYVVQTHPSAEAKAASHLERQGFSVYLPRYLKRRCHARKIQMVQAALFPRYLFVNIDLQSQRWRSIQSTIGVSRLVMNGDVPAAVPGPVVSSLRDREDERGFIVMAQKPLFSPGDKIKVLGGAFAEAFGLFESTSDRDRVAILLDLLGRKVRIMLGAEMVAAA
jgi:transcriptional antiterminator RfaH